MPAALQSLLAFLRAITRSRLDLQFEVLALRHQLAVATRGAPRIQGELRHLGINLSRSTIERYNRRSPSRTRRSFPRSSGPELEKPRHLIGQALATGDGE